MNLTSIEITNFRCFKNLKMDFFHDRLNVIIGGNASGKTAFLEAIRAALGAFFTGFEYDAVEQFYLNEKDVRISFQDGIKTEYRPIKITCKAHINGREIQWIREFNKRTKSGKKDIGAIREVARRMSQYVRSSIEVELPVLLYFSTQRLWVERKDFGAPLNGNRFGGYFNSLNAKSASFLFADWFGRMEQHAFQNAQMRLGKDFSQLDLVRQIAVRCIPDCQRMYFNALHKELFLQFSNGNEMPASSLSDGQKNLLLLCTGIALQCVLLNPHLGLKANQSKGIVLIDEIDLHLHPGWQRLALPTLSDAFPNIQFIVTTHSPQIISTAQRESVFALDQFTINPVQNYTEGRDANSVLNEIFGVPSRPIEYIEKIAEFYQAIQQQHADNAKDILFYLEDKWGSLDAEIVRARMFYEDLLNDL